MTIQPRGPGGDRPLPTVTIGVSIGLPEPHASRVQRARRSFGDAQADAIRTHVTLLPPTEVSRGSLPSVTEHLEAVAGSHPRFPMILNGTQSFRPVSPVVFIAVREGDDRCRELAQAVRAGPLTRPLEFEYHPHVTVAHHVPDDALDAAAAQMAEFQLSFEVAEFQLYVQDGGGHWQPVRSFPLTFDGACGPRYRPDDPPGDRPSEAVRER
ncbi:MAG TPA: 2'-5' RNA ligase family protein [Dermatophilaceae bacterium]|nr:2'-5' RNA ligase family protein [Dermatophilaceae bacterium]